MRRAGVNCLESIELMNIVVVANAGKRRRTSKTHPGNASTFAPAFFHALLRGGVQVGHPLTCTDLAIPFQLMRAESATVCSFGYGPTSNVVFNLLHIMVGLVILMRVDTVPPLSL